ncbi:sigma-54-dependent Fis family transcriptional regulator [Desulfopila aestuarii]|uniref:Regulatory protein, Fis family n=1 Tax=Desulfopila aestuarii DSM 18488 TaxID=1121416 RepID=A0A1M7YGP1_9BACT|nr:sigma-54-dependent Fis family transcriptional regulator [Desulfopila aestuarii]SHO51814.1 regulatory protein, Fis family [Desulfopila aestuarii DSM 18488]
MKAKDLHLKDLLQYAPDSGIIRLLDHRILIFDAMALGLLRKELIDSMGMHVARTILARFAYAHGWRTAESLKKNWSELFYKDKETGPRLHAMQGLLTHISMERTTDENGDPFVIHTWKDSYEVEQHQLHFGSPEEPVCWTISAFGSGYASNRLGQELVFIETQCTANGDPVCRVEGRLKKNWGEEYAEHLNYYSPGAIDSFLPEINKKLRKLERELHLRKKQISEIDNEQLYSQFSARSATMRKVIDLAKKIADVESTVVISGESGVGKEKIARLIHDQSPRSKQPFIAVNCGAFTETLLESELFGYIKGAFTNATSDRTGLFEAANGGTIFLDEIGDMPYAMQVKLLRVLQEREVRRIGESRARPIDVRILAATNRNLADDVENGRFRQDLYYRLRVIELKIPPMRERVEDILPLAQACLEENIRRLGRKPITFSQETLRMLLQYDWPGNVREIHNAVEYAIALTSGEQIMIDDLPEEFVAPQYVARSGPIRPLADIEREYIRSVVEMMNGNKTKAAKALQIGSATLYRKLKSDSH